MESHAVTTSIEEEQKHFSKHESKWGRFSSSFTKQNFTKAFTITAGRQYAAEFLGTLLFIYVGTGTVVALAAKGALASGATNTCIALSFGFGVACMVYATANVSGGHLNPAITIAFLCTGNIDVIRGIFYIVCQCAGSIAAAGLIRATTPSDDWAIVDGGATRLGAGISVVQGVFLELIITYMLIFTVFGTVQLRNSSTGMGKLAGLAIGLAVLVSHTFGQTFTGPSMNPARSLGPAIVFSQWENHWIYWVGPIAGGILAALTYQFILQPEDKERQDVKYKKRMEVKRLRALARQQKQPGRFSTIMRKRPPTAHLSDPGMYKPVDTNDKPFTNDKPYTVDDAHHAHVFDPHHPDIMPMDADMRDSLDRDGFTMDINHAVGQGADITHDPNISPSMASVLSDPGTTRIA